MFEGKSFALGLSAVGILGLGSVCQPGDILGSAGVNELSGSMVSFVLGGQPGGGSLAPVLEGGKGIEAQLSYSDSDSGGVCCEGAGFCEPYGVETCPNGMIEVACPCNSTQ